MRRPAQWLMQPLLDSCPGANSTLWLSETPMAVDKILESALLLRSLCDPIDGRPNQHTNQPFTLIRTVIVEIHPYQHSDFIFSHL